MTAPSGSPGSTKRIIVASFSTTDGARGALDRLKNAGTRLGNAATVQRLVDGRVEFKETQDWGVGKSALVGAIAALVIPGIGPILGAAAGGAAAHFIDAGFPDPLLRQLGSGIDMGTSMLVALVEETDRSHAERVLADGGATILGSGLEADLGRAMESLRRQ
jgi:uncharacterized membrane protein